MPACAPRAGRSVTMVVVGIGYISEVAACLRSSTLKAKGTNMKSTPAISAPRNPKGGLGVLAVPECQVAGAQVSVILSLEGRCFFCRLNPAASSPHYFMR